MIGTTVGSFRITGLIAHGGMGTVYRAEHALIGKPAAIKVLQPELSTNRSIVDRFFNEARATSAIKNPGVVEVFDFGYLPSGHAFMVMEFLDGEPLSQYIRRHGRLGEGEAAWIVRSVCSTLSAVHAHGIVHRDLKPDNIFLVPDPEMPTGARTKLLDFGIAKLSGSALAVSQTTTGAVMGTPTYMSPEQCKGSGEVDQRADLYALGCILYEMVSGRPPFTQDGAGEVLGAHLFLEPTPLRQRAPDVSIDLEAVVMRLLAKEPSQRPASAAELAQLLTQAARLSGTWQAGDPTVPVRPSGYVPSITPMLTPSAGPGQAGPGTGPGAPPASRSSGRLVGPDAATVMADDGRHLTPPPPAGTAVLPRATTTGTPTTLSGSAGQSAAGRTGAELAPAAGRRWAVIGVVAVVLVALGGGAAVVLSGGGAGPAATAPAAAAPTTPTGPTPARVEPGADPAPQPAAPPDAAPTVAPTPTASSDAAPALAAGTDPAPAGGEERGTVRPGDKKPDGKKPDGKKPGGKKPGGKKPGDKPGDKKPDGDGPGPIETDL